MPEDHSPKSPLSDVTLAIQDGSHATLKRVSKGVPLLSAKNVTASGKVKWGDGDDRISETDYAAICSSFTPREGDVLLTIVGTLGRRAIFDGCRVAFQRSVAFIRPDPSEVLSRFLFHAVGSQDYVRQLVNRSNATAQAGLYLGQLARTTIPKPSLTNQERIATVLDTVDDAITKTESVIAKLRQVRAGLLHDLLTCGLDENGELRDPIAHPEQFHDSRLGRIPKMWVCGKLGDRIRVQGGFAFRSADFVPRGVPLLRISNITGNGLDFTDAVNLPTSFLETMPDFAIRTGDVVIAMSGATTGKVAHVEGVALSALLNQRVGRFSVLNNENCRLPFVFLVTQTPRFQNHVAIESPGGAQPNISTAEIEAFRLAWPCGNEQEQIAEVLGTFDMQVNSNLANFKKLQQVKSGLINDLLTGRVRVPESIGVSG